VPSTAIPAIVHRPVPFLLALWNLLSPIYEAFTLNARQAIRERSGRAPITTIIESNLGASRIQLISRRWQETAPRHRFLLPSGGWVKKVRDVQVGGFGEWDDSDHRPVTVELSM
jgi:hypothetical protein